MGSDHRHGGAQRTLDPANDGPGPRHIEEVQRARMLAGTVQAACEEGAANVTVASVVGRAGVSRRTFYEIFDGVEACLLATIDDAVARAATHVLPAYESARAEGWRAQIAAGLASLLVFFDEQPSIARLLIVEWLGAGPAALARRREVCEALAAAVDKGCSRRRAGGSRAATGVSSVTAEGVVGAVASVLHGRLIERQPPSSLLALFGPLMSVVVLPYLGVEAARRELRERTLSSAPASLRPSAEEDIRSLGIRLTYRTTRVLTAIAARPGASNREVADAAGVRDPAQISKLLRRLEAARLVQNASVGGPLKGAPNAWSLTARGEQLERFLRR